MKFFKSFPKICQKKSSLPQEVLQNEEDPFILLKNEEVKL